MSRKGNSKIASLMTLAVLWSLPDVELDYDHNGKHKSGFQSVTRSGKHTNVEKKLDCENRRRHKFKKRKK